jgi:Fms-interacting protein/Thoc5
LIPIEQFLAEHPEKVDLDESALTIARIEHEHKGRLALEEQRQRLLKKKEGLIQANKKRKDDLANLDKDLEKFIDVGLITKNINIQLMWDLRLRNRSRRHLNQSSEEGFGKTRCIALRCAKETYQDILGPRGPAAKAV